PGDRGTRGAAAVPRARRGPLATLLHLRCRRHRAAAARRAARRRLRAARCAVREVVSRLGGARLVPRAPACDGAAPMRLGASLPLPPDLAMCRRAAERVEALGYDSVWIADTGAGPDAFVVGAAVATCTTRLRIGTAVVPVYTRTPSVMAAGAGSVAQLAPGRVVLGIGASSETIVDAWGGVTFERPLQRMRETVAVLRQMLAGERVTFAGQTLRTK